MVAKARRQSGASRIVTITLCATSFTLGAFIWWLAVDRPYLAETERGLTAQAVRLVQSQYPLISPLLLCNVNLQNNFNENKALYQQVNNLVDEKEHAGLAQDISMYFQDYKDGRWAGVNEDTLYSPASLTKVPLMIAFLEMAQNDPGVLARKVTFSGPDLNASEYYRSPDDVIAGTPRTVDELIRSMIVNSDNNAAVALQKIVDTNTLKNTFTDLTLSAPPRDVVSDRITVRRYAYFFRVLFNGTYLDNGLSEKALELLTASTFVSGLKAGVPSDVAVAHKFGEYTVLNDDGSVAHRELHDCGIVYLPNHPYLLCIMTRGDSFDSLAQNIKDISALVYRNEATE